MKEIGKTMPSLGTICDMLEIRGGEISKEDICTTGRFTTDLLRYISNRKIHRISTFVTKDCHLSLVSGYQKWDNRSSRQFFIERNLT